MPELKDMLLGIGSEERDHDGIAIGVDETDHISFFCERCKGVMRVKSVRTEKIVVSDRLVVKRDKCTWIALVCPKCDKDYDFGNHQRKFYWTCDDGRFATNRTDK